MAYIDLILDGTLKGEIFILFYTERCGSCAETHEILQDIMRNRYFDSKKLIIVDRHFLKRLELITKYKINNYPCLIRTKDTLLIDVYTGLNIIKIFETGLI